MSLSSIVTENRRLEAQCMNLVGRNFLYRAPLKQQVRNYLPVISMSNSKMMFNNFRFPIGFKPIWRKCYADHERSN